MKRFSQFMEAMPFLLATLLFPLVSTAQSSYQPGVIVNLQGDTVRGFINYTDWRNNPQSILFKPDLAATPQEFTPQAIKYFNVNIGHLAEYVKYTGLVSTDNTDTYHLSTGRDSSYRQDTVFLRVVQHGKKLLLFSYTDAQKIRFFMAGNFSEKPVELVYRIYLNGNDANGINKTTEYEFTYRGQLYDAAVRAGVMNPLLKKNIKKADYTEEDLLPLASIINGVSEKDALKNNPSKHSPFNATLAILGGLVVIVGLIVEFSSLHHQSK